MLAPAVPAEPKELSPEWMTAALRSCAPAHPRVVGLEWEPVSAGLGFAGQVVRVRLEYDSQSADAPETVIAKFAAPLRSARELLNDFGGYQREVKFYAEMSDRAGLPAPRCYYGGYDELSGTFVLLLEDMAAARLGDQVSGATLAEAEFIVTQLARFHARWWNDASLLQQSWLWPSEAAIRRLPELFEQGIGPLRETMQDRFSDVLKLVERMTALVPSLAATFGEQFPPKPFTLVHGDMRLDNLFFPSESDGRFAVVDWQGVAVGSPGNELAYFLVLSLPVGVRREHEAPLLARYHSELAENGVTGYPLRQLRRDYSRGILVQLLGLPVLSGTLDFGSERGQALASAALERISAAAVDLKAARTISVLTWITRLQDLAMALRRRTGFFRRSKGSPLR